MKKTVVAVIGSGAREAAIAHTLTQEWGVHVLAMPGNPGMANWDKVTVLPNAKTSVDWLAAAREHVIKLVVVGPEAPLMEGVVNMFKKDRLPTVGPIESAAQITEGSKVAAFRLCQRHKIPVPESHVANSAVEALSRVAHYAGNCVVKADGLAAGKGVKVCGSQAEAEEAVDELAHKYGYPLLIQERLVGQEISFMVATDGLDALPLIPAKDYKRLLTDNGGPNTGGMGSLADYSLLSEKDERNIFHNIAMPVLAALRREGKPYRGILYIGLMKVAEGMFRVLEFNARMGDPETQSQVSLLGSSLFDLLWATTQNGRIKKHTARWLPRAAVTVVMASRGYPNQPALQQPIYGIPAAENLGVKVFPAGVEADQSGSLYTSGGRVLSVTATGASLHAARELAYAGVARIHSSDLQYRTDIGA